MDNNAKLRNLINRAISLDQMRPLNEENIRNVERILGIVLPDDFKAISKEYDYEFFSVFDFYNFGPENEHSVVKVTLDCRYSFGLPEHYLVLSQDDASVIVMKCGHTQLIESPIIWCAIEDVYNLCEEKPLQYKPTIFPSFADFFEYLLDQEEEERKCQEKS